MTRILSGALVSFIFALPAVCASGPIVDLGYAKYEGTYNATTQTTRFIGVRYAAPPTGDLRWNAPQNPKIVHGVQKANAEPPMCFTANHGNSPTTPFRQNNVVKRLTTPSTSEDCLFLNVHVAGDLSKDRKKLPVVVWIHGGGYMIGSASGFNGDDLVRESNHGVVAVVIQYRLGAFGFLAGKKVKAGGALNAGLLDQEFALRWVQKHIFDFGGDPSQVSIWGESAGAGSVLQHVIAHDGKTTPPLFRGAIMSSVFLPSQYPYDDAIPEKMYSELVAQTNCSLASDSLACLRSVDPNTLESANVNIGASAFFGTWDWVPVVDGTLITQRPTEALKQRKLNGDVALAVTNTNEGGVFINSNTADTVQVSDYVAQLFPKFGPTEIATATAQYKGLGTPIFQVAAIMGEAIFVCPTYTLLRAFSGRSYKGWFAIPPSNHGGDLPYYFPSTRVLLYNNPAFVKAFSESFLDFAMFLNPNAKSDPTNITPRWSTWSGGFEMLFNRTEAGAPDVRPVATSADLLKRCSFWESVAALTGQ